MNVIITTEILKNFNGCVEELPIFTERYPDGLDITDLWGTPEEADTLWNIILQDDFLKRYIGWGIHKGVLPARIRANLSGADLSRAYLSGANLSGADLSRANLSRADLSRANHNHLTRWPEGFSVFEETI